MVLFIIYIHMYFLVFIYLCYSIIVLFYDFSSEKVISLSYNGNMKSRRSTFVAQKFCL